MIQKIKFAVALLHIREIHVLKIGKSSLYNYNQLAVGLQLLRKEQREATGDLVKKFH